jgi:hypothetical protein
MPPNTNVPVAAHNALKQVIDMYGQLLVEQEHRFMMERAQLELQIKDIHHTNNEVTARCLEIEGKNQKLVATNEGLAADFVKMTQLIQDLKGRVDELTEENDALKRENERYVPSHLRRESPSHGNYGNVGSGG